MTAARRLVSRRVFLGVSGALSAGVWIGSEAGGRTSQAASASGRYRQFNAWITVHQSGVVELRTGKVELGQGILTAFTQIVADALDVPYQSVTVRSGDTSDCPDDGITAGSMSLSDTGMRLRRSAREIRGVLVALAAVRWSVATDGLETREGRVIEADGRSASYAELLDTPVAVPFAAVASAGDGPLRRRWVGRPVPRIDLEAKFSGSPAFLHDLTLPDMLHGRIVRPPTYGARLLEVDSQAVQSRPGILAVVRNGSFLGVVGRHEEAVVAAAAALASSARWESFPSTLDHRSVQDWLRRQSSHDSVIHERHPPDATPHAVTELKAVYTRPYQMHASIGPSVAVARFDAEALEIHSHSQSVFDTREAIAAMLGLPPERVRMRHRPGAGCYGHNGADDVAADAALLAYALPGAPIRVQWSREDEHAWEPYGSAMQIELRGSLDSHGRLVRLAHDLWSTTHGARPNGGPGNLLAAGALAKPFEQPTPRNVGPPHYGADRNAIAPYEVPEHVVTTHFVPATPVRVSSLRSLGAYANVFAAESFMDELANAAGRDPVQFRMDHLQDPRAKTVIQQAAERFGWHAWRPAGASGRGIGFARYKNLAAYCCVCIEVQVNSVTGEIAVVRAVAAVDVGEIVNPDGVRSQIEGGVVQSLSWTLKEEVEFSGNRVLSRGWAQYPILTFSEVPPIEVVLVNGTAGEFLGAGEASQGPTAGALANAVFDAYGCRLRDIPFTPNRVVEALSRRRSRVLTD